MSSNVSFTRLPAWCAVSLPHTYRQASVHARFNDLVALFGNPDSEDGYKVSGSWTFVLDIGQDISNMTFKTLPSRDELAPNGVIITLYDWKSTSLYDSSYPSVEEFRRNPKPHRFEVGGSYEAKPYISDFIRFLSSKLASLGSSSSKTTTT